MNVISGRSSSSPSGLNPNAPLFVPWAYRTVEDFSDQWWDLVKSSSWFRDYWLQECFQLQQQQQEDEMAMTMMMEEEDPFLPDDADDLFYQPQKEEDRVYARDLMKWGAEKWHGQRPAVEIPRYLTKAPKAVNLKVTPRMIQQPR